MSRVGRINRENKVVEVRIEAVGKGGEDKQKKEERCQNCAPGSNLQRQARPPPFTLNHYCDLFFSTLSSIHHLSGPSVAVLLLSSPLHKLKPCQKARVSAEYKSLLWFCVASGAENCAYAVRIRVSGWIFTRVSKKFGHMGALDKSVQNSTLCMYVCRELIQPWFIWVK